jgi:hypothetical protein
MVAPSIRLYLPDPSAGAASARISTMSYELDALMIANRFPSLDHAASSISFPSAKRINSRGFPPSSGCAHSSVRRSAGT